MECSEAGSTCCYHIDGKDRIVSVSDNWLVFAQENEAAESCHPEKIINRSIWEFIDGIETQLLYDIVLKNIRRTNKSVRLPFRCDAPGKRRYLELRITPVLKGTIEFASTIIREELRDSIEMLEFDIPRSDELVRMCSMCKKVELPGNCWVEIEAAIVTLKLFEKLKQPQISHGLCHDCYILGMAEVDKL